MSEKSEEGRNHEEYKKGRDKENKKNDFSKFPKLIQSKIGLNLHNKKGHPLCLIKEAIYGYFKSIGKIKDFFENFDPLVSVTHNFDLLLIEKSHPSRSESDTYYLDQSTVLRTHTSAHQNELLSKGHDSFLVTGDVYRKDEIDKYHYPIFHQMEGVYLLPEHETETETETEGNLAITDLKETVGGLVKFLFPNNEYRFGNDYFPFTDPSFEVEVKFGEKWLEIVGCGVIHHNILGRYNIKRYGWAFGFGLERIAMIMFNIPDIRLFWTNDNKFHSQFADINGTDNIDKIRSIVFKPYSLLEPITRDMSFWIPEDQIEILDNEGQKQGQPKQQENKTKTQFKWKHENKFYEYVREVCLDEIGQVSILDKFIHPKFRKYSYTVRFHIFPDANFDNPAEIASHANKLISKIQGGIEKDIGIKLR